MNFRAVFKLTRPHNCIFAGIAVLIGAIISAEGLPPLRISFAFVAAALITAAGNSINDYADRELDAINSPDRPIPSGKISPSGALIFSAVLFVVGIISAVLIGRITCIAIAIINSVLLAYYATSLKRKGLIGNVVIGYLVGSTFLFGGLAAGEFETVLILGAMAGFSTAGRELIKDIEDVKGDKKSGSKSFPLGFGKKKAAILAIIFTTLAILMTPIPYQLGLFGKIYLLPVAISVAAFILGMMKIGRDQKKESASRASFFYKIAMGLGLIAFLAGALL